MGKQEKVGGGFEQRFVVCVRVGMFVCVFAWFTWRELSVEFSKCSCKFGHIEFLPGIAFSWNATERLFGLYVIQPSKQYSWTQNVAD